MVTVDLNKYRRIAFCYFNLENSNLDSEELSILNRLAKEAKINQYFTKSNLKLVIDNPNKRVYNVIGVKGKLVYLVDHYDNSFSGSLFTPTPKTKQVSKEEATEKIQRYLQQKTGE